MSNIPSLLIRAFEELAPDEKDFFRRRYVCFESIKHTCEALNITELQYQAKLESFLRKIRRPRRVAHTDQFVPDPA